MWAHHQWDFRISIRLTTLIIKWEEHCKFEAFGQVTKSCRKELTPHQLRRLEDMYRMDKYVSKTQIRELAIEMGCADFDIVVFVLFCLISIPITLQYIWWYFNCCDYLINVYFKNTDFNADFGSAYSSNRDGLTYNERKKNANETHPWYSMFPSQFPWQYPMQFMCQYLIRCCQPFYPIVIFIVTDTFHIDIHIEVQ